MYAVIEAGGRQWKVQPGSRLEINRLSSAVGATHTVDRVLLAHDGTQVQIGRPYVEGAKVVCEVLEHRLGPKTIAYHFRRRENWRKTVGYRQPLTHLLVKDILFSAAVTAAEEPAAAPVKVRAPKATSPQSSASSKPRKTSVKRPAKE